MQKNHILLKKLISKSHAINPRKKKHGFFFFFFINFIFFLFFFNIVLSIDSLPVSLTPENATTLDNIICSWNTTNFQKVNVTWYNGTNIYSEIKETTSIQVLSSFIAKKNQIWNCSVVEWNNSLNYGSAKTTIINAPPYQPNVINDSIEEDSLYSRDIATTDPDNDAIISYMCVPSKFSITESTISWQPVSSDVEPLSSKLYNFTCIAFDSDFSSSSKKFFLNVTAKNDNPYFVSLNNVTKNESQKLQHIISVSDEENPSGLFNLSFNSYNCPYNPVSVFEIIRTSNNSFIFQVINNLTLTINEIGNCTINLTLYDPLTTSVNYSQLFNIEVITTNHQPNFTYIESKDRYYNQSENFQLLINATDIDENELLSFTITTPYCSVSPWNITLLNNSNNASALIKAFPLNESHIKCKIINLKVIDSKNAYSNITLELNVSNVNDAPVINELSFHINNTFSNNNLSNLTAYSFVEFRYYVNATDIDIDYQTDLTDYLTYDSNSTLCIDCPYFLINPNTGEIRFAANESHIGKNFSYKVNVTDKYGLFDEKILKITILNNSVPFFNQSVPNIYAKEDLLYTLKINASDLEDKNVSFYINTTLFNISNEGLINFTPTCLDVGNYSVLIKIFDSLGAENSTIINVSINMSPDMPFISNLQNITLFEDEIFSTYLTASDDDLLCNQFDNLIFNYSFIIGNETNFTFFNLENQNNSENYKSLLTLQAKDKGNFLINFSVQDLYNYKSSILWNISIVNRSNAPIINNITPYGSPYTNFSTSWRPFSNFLGAYTNLNISENMTLYFNHNSTDEDQDQLNFTWLKDGYYLNSSKNISYYFDFTSFGLHNITLIVSDIINNKTANNVSFSWNISVRNLNRQPYLNNTLPNITINKTISLPNYFICNDVLPGFICNGTRFVDPDNDNLTFTKTSTTKADVTIQGNSLLITGKEIGTETIVFYASDGQYNIQSNNVTITITEIQQPETRTTSSSSSSSSSSQSTSYVPYAVLQEVEKEKEIYLDIIAPDELVIYQNNSLRQLINIVNNGNQTLRGISLSAKTNSTTAKIEFSDSIINELKPKEIAKTDLIINDYKLMNHYEIIIYANVSDPSYKDKAIIYVNAIEKSRGNQSVTATKITFANDLLASNPECLELNEYLKKAQNFIEERNYNEAEKIVDSVIQGCKYLVSQSKLKEESPKDLFLNFQIKNPYIRTALILTFIAIVLIIILTINLKKSNSELEQQ